MRQDTISDGGLEYQDESNSPGLHKKRDDNIAARKLGVATLAPPRSAEILHYLPFI